MATAAKLIGSEVSWSSVSVAIQVCGEHGHNFMKFDPMGAVMCNHCGLTREQIYTGVLRLERTIDAPSS